MPRRAVLSNRQQLVLHVARDLHRFRKAILQGIHHLPTAPLDLYASVQAVPLTERPSLKLKLTMEDRTRIEKFTHGLDPETRAPRQWPLWVVVSVALSLVSDAPAGRTSEARTVGRTPAARRSAS